MSKISEPGYLFIHSGVLEKEQIEKSLLDCCKYLTSNSDKGFSKTKFKVNVVKNKDGMKYGHTYAWIEDISFFNALIGKNFDGSDRIELYDDPDWKPPEKSRSDYWADVLNSSDSFDFDWADNFEEEQKYICPKLKRELEPLVSLPAVKYTEEQKKEINYESEFGFMEIFPIKLSQKFGRMNVLFTNDIPEWVTEDLLFKYFKQFEKDDRIHSDKKSRKKFQYPIVKIKSKKDFRGLRRFGTVSFSSMYPNTVTFLINVVKRVDFTDGKNSALLFFSQSKTKDKMP